MAADQAADNAASLVVPLSIAYHQRADYAGCRQAMVIKGGKWRFAFFDREPQALFGEDVKTRNAILFRRETENDPERGTSVSIETGPLRNGPAGRGIRCSIPSGSPGSPTRTSPAAFRRLKGKT